MTHHRDTGGPGARRIAALALIAAAVVGLGGWGTTSAVRAQNMMRSPSIHIAPHVPVISNTVHISPNVGPGVGVSSSVGRLGPSARMVNSNTSARLGLMDSRLPYVRYPHNKYPGCDDVKRTADGECHHQITVVDDGGTGGPGKKGRSSGPRRNNAQAADMRYFAGQLVIEVEAARADDLARRHRLGRLHSPDIPPVGATPGPFRLTHGRPVEAAPGG